MKCVIFDMDGTLIDSAKAICETVNEVRRELGLRGDLAYTGSVQAWSPGKPKCQLPFNAQITCTLSKDVSPCCNRW